MEIVRIGVSTKCEGKLHLAVAEKLILLKKSVVNVVSMIRRERVSQSETLRAHT